MSKSPRDQWAEWLLSRRHGGDPEKYEAEVEALHPLRDQVLERAKIAEGDVVLDIGAGDGLIAFGAIEQVGEEGQVIFSDISQYLLDFCQSVAQQKGIQDRCQFLRVSADDLSVLEDRSVEVITVRSVLIYISAKQRVFQEFYRILKPAGRLSIFEPINRFGYPLPAHLLWGYDVTPIQGIAQKVRAMYEDIQPPETDPMSNFDERDLLTFAEEAGFAKIDLELRASIWSASAGRSWEDLMKMAPNPRVPTLEEAMAQALTSKEVKQLVRHLRPLVEAGQETGRGASAFLWAVK